MYVAVVTGSCHFVPVQDRDVEEGADILMVKPGMPYLDIVRDTKERVSCLRCTGEQLLLSII